MGEGAWRPAPVLCFWLMAPRQGGLALKKVPSGVATLRGAAWAEALRHRAREHHPSEELLAPRLHRRLDLRNERGEGEGVE
jgi:hypothetical protein